MEPLEPGEIVRDTSNPSLFSVAAPPVPQLPAVPHLPPSGLVTFSGHPNPRCSPQFQVQSQANLLSLRHAFLQIDNEQVPVIYRDQIPFVSVRLVESLFLAQYPRDYPASLRKTPPIKSYYFSPEEANCLNAVTSHRWKFSTKDLLVVVDDFKEFYSVVKHFFSADSTEPEGGWLQINNTVVPYVWRGNHQMLPLCVLRYGARLLVDETLTGISPLIQECAFLNDISSKAGLDFNFDKTTSVVSVFALENIEKNVRIRALPKEENPFTTARYEEELTPEPSVFSSQSSSVMQCQTTQAIPSFQPPSQITSEADPHPASHSTPPPVQPPSQVNSEAEPPPISGSSPAVQQPSQVSSEAEPPPMPDSTPPVQMPSQVNSEAEPPPAPDSTQDALPNSVQVKLELGHTAILRGTQTSGGFTHNWSVFVRGAQGSNIQPFVEKVIFHLHESFPRPTRVIKEPPYQVSESGYGSFTMPIEIYFKNKEEPNKVMFDYDVLLLMDNNNNNIRCEKLTFMDPDDEFKRKLLKAGGKQLYTPQPEPQQATSTSEPSFTPTPPSAATKETPTDEDTTAPAFNLWKYRNKTCSVIVKGNEKYVLLEALCSVFYPGYSLRHFLACVDSIMASKVITVTEAEEKAFISFYKLPVKNLKANRMINIKDFHSEFDHLQAQMKHKAVKRKKGMQGPAK